LPRAFAGRRLWRRRFDDSLQDYRFRALKCYNFAWVTALVWAMARSDRAGRQAKYPCPQVGLRLMFDKIEAYLSAKILCSLDGGQP